MGQEMAERMGLMCAAMRSKMVVTKMVSPMQLTEPASPIYVIMWCFEQGPDPLSPILKSPNIRSSTVSHIAKIM
jgi:hypothetical protein